MIRRSTWIVIGLFALLVGFAVLLQRYQVNKSSTAATSTPSATPVYLYQGNNDQFNDIKIADNTGNTIEFYFDASTAKWAIKGTPANEADSSKISSLSSQLLSIQVNQVLTEALPLASIGLEPPAYTISVTTSAGFQNVTYIGTQNAIGTGYYVRREDGQVMIVLKSALDDILGSLKKPPLLPTPTPEVTPTGSALPAIPVSQATPTP